MALEMNGVVKDSGEFALVVDCLPEASIGSTGGTSGTEAPSSGDSDFVLSRSSCVASPTAPLTDVFSLPSGESGIAKRSISLPEVGS